VPVTAERGQWLSRPDGRQVLITLHPSALLRVLPEDREKAFAAFTRDLGEARKLFAKG
jgi:uracil-DNA glycosylase